jgi:hypothetical protein
MTKEEFHNHFTVESRCRVILIVNLTSRAFA